MDMVQLVLVQMPGDQKGSAGLGMADNEHVGTHGRQVIHGVEQGLALAGGRSGNVQVDDIGGKALCGDFKGCSRPGGVFEEQIENTFAAH